MRSSILTATLLAVFTPTRDAEACSPPLVYWGIGSTIPADGTTDVPIDAGITVRGQTWGGVGASEPLADIEVLVTRDGEPVPGTLVHSAYDTTHWRANADLEANARHEVHVVIGHDYEGPPEDFEVERTFHFVTGDAGSPAPKTPDAPEATAEGLEYPIVRTSPCRDGRFSDGCGDCWETEELGWETRLRFEAAHPAVDGRWPEGSVATLQVGPEPETSKTRTTVYLSAQGAAWSGGLGPRRDWDSDQVCFQVTVVTPGGRTADGPVECLAIAPIDPDEEPPTVDPDTVDPDRVVPDSDTDAEADLRPSGGCETTGHSAGAWLLLALLPALRRRQRLTGR